MAGKPEVISLSFRILRHPSFRQIEPIDNAIRRVYDSTALHF